MSGCCRSIAMPKAPRLDVLGWTLSTATLVLMPKCPMCVAAYVALGTGIGLSLPVAAAVRWILIGLCAATLVVLGIRQMVAMVTAHRP
jgi:hypothetical protein